MLIRKQCTLLILFLSSQILSTTHAQGVFLKELQAKYDDGQYEAVVSDFDKWKAASHVDTNTLLFAKLCRIEAASYGMMNQFDISIPKSYNAIGLLEQYDSTQSIVAELYDDIVVDYRLSGDFENAKNAGRDLVNYARQNLDTLSVDFAAYVVRTSYPYMTFDQPEIGDSIVSIGLEIFAAIDEEMHPDINMAYNIKGIYNKNRGDYAAAIQWYSKAKKVLEYNNQAESVHYVTILHNMANVQRLTGKIDTAIYYLFQAVDLNEEIYGTGTLENEYVYTSLSNCFILKEDYKKGLKFGKLSLEMAEKLYGRESAFYIENELTYRENLLIAGYNEEAIENHEDLGRRIVAKFGDKAETYAYYVRQVGKGLKNIGKYDEAIPQLLTSLTDFGINPENIAESYRIKDPASFMSVMSEVSDSYLRKWQASSDIKALHNAEKYADLGIQYIQELRKQSAISNTKLLFTNSQSDFISQAIQVQYDLYNQTQTIVNLDKGLKYIELSKNILFTENLKSRDILTSTLIPQQELVRAQELRIEIEKTEDIVNNSDSDSLQVIALNHLHDLQNKESEWFAKVDKTYPKFKNRHYGNWEKSVGDIKNEILSEDELILDYLKTDNAYYVIGISAEEYSFRHIPVSQLSNVSFVRDPQNIRDEDLNRLFQILIQPEIARHKNIERITIMPSGELTFIPFEALIMADGIPAVNNYTFRQLINFESSRVSENSGANLLAIAPDYSNEWIQDDDEVYASLVRAGQWKLPGAQLESKSIIDLLGGKFLSGIQATKSNFEQLAPNYGLLHLSMHTLPTDKNVLSSSLVFSPNPDGRGEERLTLEEIYNLNLNAQMVTLSACNTGVGEHVQGEGVISLAHAFGVAGVPSTVMSLWKVPDESTSQIMIAYYNYLKNGLSKDKALQSAKLEYLENTVAKQQRHPFYWAGFVVVGDVGPIDFSPPGTSWYLWLGGALLLLGIFWIYNASRRRRALVEYG